jgi:hypothetical protein
MTLLTIEGLDSLHGSDVIDQDGAKIGTLDEIYVDEETRQPEWAEVRTGLFGMSSRFVPLKGATSEENRLGIAHKLGVAHQRSQVKDAPRVDPDGRFSQRDQAELTGYYRPSS